MRLPVSLALVMALAFTSSQAAAQMGKIDTKHVSDESFCVVRLDLERIVGHLKESRKSFESMGKEFAEESGLDLTKMKALSIQFGDSDIDDGEPSFAITFEFSDKVNKDKFLEEEFGGKGFSKEKINGKTYLKPDSKHEPHFYFESDRKFTMATPGAIENVLKAGGGMGPMSSGLKSAPPGSEIIVVFKETEKFKESIDEVMDGLKQTKLPLNLEELIGKGESGFAYVNLASSNPLFVRLAMKTEESAKEFQTGLNATAAMGKAALPAAKATVDAQLKELGGAKGFGAMQKELMEMAQSGLGVAAKVLAGLNISSKQNTIEIKVRHMGGMTEAADLMVHAVMTTIFGGRGLDAAPDRAFSDVEKDLAPARATKKN